MRLVFKGRPVLAGTVSGEAVVGHGGFNTYASFFESIHEPSDTAVCADRGNADLYGRDLADKIICVPNTTGSTSGGAVWQRLVKMGNAPKAILFANAIDSLAAGGLIVADLWAGRRIVVIDHLGDEFLETVVHGDAITIGDDGGVVIRRTGARTRRRMPQEDARASGIIRRTCGRTVDEPQMRQLPSRQSKGRNGVDALDRRILIELQQDGSLTNARLAQMLGLSQSAMSERVRRLEQDGHIAGYRALVNPASLGLGLQAFVAAELNHHSTECIESFERGIVTLTNLRACYHVSGRFDYLLHVAVRDVEHLGQLIKSDIAAIPGVDKVETMLVYSEVKPESGWPVPREDSEE